MAESGLRPITSLTELRMRVAEDATEIPVLSVNGFRPDADKLLGDECIRCEAFITDVYGWPVMTGCQRGLRQEDGFAPPRNWAGGTPVAEIEWRGVIDVITDIPSPLPAEWANRTFIYQDTFGDQYTFNVTAKQDGVLYIDWVNQPPDDAALALALASGISLPTTYDLLGVALDPSGNIYTSRNYLSADQVVKYNSALAFQWSNGPTGGVRHLTTDGTNVYVALATSRLIGKYLCSTGAAGSPASFGTAGTGAGQFQEPHGITHNATHVFVTDRVRNKVIKFTLAGVYVSEFGVAGSGSSQISGPTGIALDVTGNIYVCDTGNDRIQKFDSSGSWVESFGSPGNGNGQFSGPEGIDVDSSGNLWIADTGNHRVQMLDATGAYLASAGNFGSGLSGMISPKDISLGDGYGYVLDSGNHRLSRIKVASDHSHTNVVTARTSANNVLPGTPGNATATCNADEICTGGGFSHPAGNTLVVVASIPFGNGWRFSVFNGTAGTVTLTVYAMCMKVVI